MVAVSSQEAERFLHSAPSEVFVFLFHGSDAGLISERVARCVRSFVPDLDDPFSVARLAAEDLASDSQRLVDEARTIALFSSLRCVWVDATSSGHAPGLDAVLKEPPASVRIVIAAGNLRRDSLLRKLCARAASAQTLNQAVCRLIERSAARYHIPVPFFTRLIWSESSFRAGAVSPVDAQGIAQFMPGTALERGLADPFDPEQAIPKSAHLLDDLAKQFGNFGLAAAAYNAGPSHVTSWLDKTRGLPSETQAYVLQITGQPAQSWALQGAKPASLAPSPKPSCRPV